ncbi:hypothetical protein QBC34DRAFT_440696 [Podospora aff. communis PSN243]|uniref:CUB domain-containing protein n=1 Tax=Podospora aff. communis PSN243 TaxID=3040156 RepID=A0AAV9GE04_9PEZI|nr:hypothetical protein QBC34DRAFT_440696 [Podospora aff. communis PSN243]
MLAIVIVLIKVDGVALASWTFPIQPNSVISIFITISKSALLLPISECISQSKWFRFSKTPRPLIELQDIDEASRGPLGSAQLLISPRTAGGTAWLGALLTVASLALGPFTQQVLTFPSRDIPSLQDTAQVIATQSLEKVSRSGMQEIILSSLHSASQSPLNYTCTTSSCQWRQPVTSLGVCSTCRNITPLVIPVCSTRSGPLEPEENEPWDFTTMTCTYNITAKNSFPIHIQTLYLPAADGRPAEHANHFTRRKIFSPSLNSNLTDLLHTDARWLTNTISWSTDYDKETHPQPPVTMTNLAPELILCGFYLCAQEYPSLSIINNTLVDPTPVSLPLHQPLTPSTNSTPTQPSLITLPNDQGKAELLTYPLTLPSSPSNFTSTPSSLHPPSNPHPKSQNTNTTFLIAQQALFNLQGILSSTFTFTHSDGNSAFSVFPESNSGTQGLLAGGRKITDTFSRVAESVTSEIMIAQGSTTIPGEAMVQETFVRVRWEWMVLPLWVVLGVVGLLAGTIWKGKRGGVGIWKGSSLAVLMHEVRGCEREVGGLRDLEGMGEFARGVTVKLERGEGDGGKAGRMGFVRVVEKGVC